MVAFFGDWTNAFVAALAASSSARNKNELRYDQMIEALKLPPAAIECIDDPRSRVLFRGFDAGCRDDRIRTAFKILYRDLLPIRVAGDLIFGHLTQAANQASGIHKELLTKMNSVDTNAAAQALATSRRLFDLVDGDNSGCLDREELLAVPELIELIRSGIDDTDNTIGNDDNSVVDHFMDLADENGDGVISFVEFANATATQPQLRLVDDALGTVLQLSSGPAANEVFSSQRQKMMKKKGRFGRKSPDERFDDMLRQCLEWEELLGCGPESNYDNNNANDLIECKVDVILEEQQGREENEDGWLMQVLKGTLVGAHCDPVVDALRMCYLDYSPLRLGGDVIFKLLGRVVQTQVPSTKKNVVNN